MSDKQELKNYTQIPDEICQAFGPIVAAVWGRMWRYSQMDDGVCKASYHTIAEWLGISKATIFRHIKTLEENGLLIDLTPYRIKSPHEYRVLVPESSNKEVPDNLLSNWNSESVIKLKQNYNQNETDKAKSVVKLMTKESNSKKDSKKPKPEKTPSSVKSLVSSFQELIGYPIPVWGRESKAAKWLLDNGYTREQIFSCWESMSKDDFWKDKHISLQHVQSRIGKFCSNNNNGHDTPTADLRPVYIPTILEAQDGD